MDVSGEGDRRRRQPGNIELSECRRAEPRAGYNGAGRERSQSDSGEHRSGTAQIQIKAVDNVAVTSVKCFINGSLLGTSSSASPVFAWDTTRYADGSYTVQAQAYDAAGNSSAVSVTGVKVLNIALVSDKTAPTVAITSPVDRPQVVKNLSVKTIASDNVAVTKVELYVDGKLDGSSTSLTRALLLIHRSCPGDRIRWSPKRMTQLGTRAFPAP